MPPTTAPAPRAITSPPSTGAAGADAITAAVALTLCVAEIVARAAVAAFVLGRSIRRAIASTSAAPRRQCRPIAPHVQPLFELLTPLSNAQLRRALGAHRKESAIRTAALCVA